MLRSYYITTLTVYSQFSLLNPWRSNSHCSHHVHSLKATIWTKIRPSWLNPRCTKSQLPCSVLNRPRSEPVSDEGKRQRGLFTKWHKSFFRDESFSNKTRRLRSLVNFFWLFSVQRSWLLDVAGSETCSEWQEALSSFMDNNDNNGVKNNNNNINDDSNNVNGLT